MAMFEWLRVKLFIAPRPQMVQVRAIPLDGYLVKVVRHTIDRFLPMDPSNGTIMGEKVMMTTTKTRAALY